MVEKFKDEEFIHNFPFKIEKHDRVILAEVKAYEPKAARRAQGAVTGPALAGFIENSQQTTFSLNEDEEFLWEVRPRDGALPEVPGLLGSISVTHTEHDEAIVQVPLKAGGEVGRQYLLVARIRTALGAQLLKTETMYIKPLA